MEHMTRHERLLCGRIGRSIVSTDHGVWWTAWNQCPYSFCEHIINLPHNSVGPPNRGSDQWLRSSAWLESNRSSAVLRCRTTRIPTTIVSTRLRLHQIEIFYQF